jgi:hypothetical protein
MSKPRPNTDLAAMIPTRLAPPVATPRALDTAERPASASHRQANRVSTIMIAGHFEADVSFALKGLCSQMSMKKGQRVTVQLALAEALGILFERYGVMPPEGLRLADPEAPANTRTRRSRTAARS